MSYMMTLHNMGPIELDFELNCPDPENVWISLLNIFKNTWIQISILLWVQKNISQIVIKI